MTEHKYYRYYVLMILTLTYVVSVMDRKIMSILLQDIKVEFELSDSQLGLLVGLAFALFYATLGVPVARLADRWNRKKIISIAIVVWSVATALCGLAMGFWSLFLARVLVGIGESGGTAPAHSLISDFFKRAELSRAVAIFTLGSTFGGVIGYSVGGMLAEQYGWRIAFFALGLPGVLLAAIVWFTVVEPVRGRLTAGYDSSQPQPSFQITLRSLLSNKPYIGTMTGHVIAGLVGSGFVAWLAVIVIRNFGLETTQVGLLLSSATLIGTLPGILIGGFLTDFLSKRDIRWMAFVPAIALALSLPAFVLSMLSSNVWLMLILFSWAIFLYMIHLAPGMAIVHLSVAPNERTLALALTFFFTNLLGLGLGPVLIGSLSDLLAPTYGNRSLSVAMAGVSFLMIPASLVYFWTARQLGRFEADTGTQPVQATV